MIRSHSATASLHAPQLNPIAADILRKEPEHETFSRINITAVGMDHFHSYLCNFIVSFISFTNIAFLTECFPNWLLNLWIGYLLCMYTHDSLLVLLLGLFCTG
jgi:hypothetical protein